MSPGFNVVSDILSPPHNFSLGYFFPPDGLGGGVFAGGRGAGLESLANSPRRVGVDVGVPFRPVGGFSGNVWRLVTMSLADDLAGASLDTLREIIRNAESYLGAQLTSGLAANQRAMTFTSLIAGATVVVGGAAASLAFGTAPRMNYACVALLVAGGFLVAMFLAMRAAKPTDFETVGNTPAGWRNDVLGNKPFERSLAEQAAWYAEMIESNHACMIGSDAQIVWAMRIAWGSLVYGVLAVGAIIGAG